MPGRPRHHFLPEDWLAFTELKPFSRLWQRLELTDDDLLLLQLTILCDPHCAPVIPGTGGLRKLRFAPRKSSAGKRDSLRVCYAFFPVHHRVILAAVYPKSLKDDLSADDKKIIRAAIMQIERELNSSIR